MFFSKIKNIYLKHQDCFLIIAIFLFATLLLSAISIFAKHTVVFPDETFYYDIARSIFYGGGNKFFNFSIGFQKIAYSLIIAPFFAIKDSVLRIYMISLFNATILATSIFPLWLISRRFVEKKYCYVIIGLHILFPYMLFSLTLMAETLYYPLLLWVIYFWLYNREKHLYPVAIFLGALLYFTFLCKEIAIIFLIALVLVNLLSPFIEFLIRKNKQEKVRSFFDKKTLICDGIAVLSFLAFFLIFKFTLFLNFPNFYTEINDQMSFSAIDTFPKFCFMIYGFIYILCAFALSVFLLPVIWPSFTFKKMNVKNRFFYLFLLLFIVIMAITMAFTITVREDLWRVAPRPMLRYFGPISIFFLLLMFSNNNVKTFLTKKSFIGLCIFLLVFILVYKGTGSGPGINASAAFWYNMIETRLLLAFGAYNFDYSLVIVFVNLAICVIFFFSHYFDYKFFKNKHIIFIGCALVANIFSFSYGAYYLRSHPYDTNTTEIKNVQQINNFLDANYPNAQVLCLSDNSPYNFAVYNTYYNSTNNYTFMDAKEFEKAINNIHTPNIAVNNIKFLCPLFNFEYEKRERIDFVVLRADLKFASFDFIDITPVEGFEQPHWHLYQNKNPTQLSFKFN